MTRTNILTCIIVATCGFALLKCADDSLAVQPTSTETLRSFVASKNGFLLYRDDKSIRGVNLGNRKITDSDMEVFRNIDELELCVLSSNDITDVGLNQIKHLKGLDTLSVRGTKVSDQGAAVLRGFKSLRVLSLDDTAIGDMGLSQIGSCTNIEVLSLRNTRVTNAGLAHLRGMTRLRELDLVGEGIDGDCLNSLGPALKRVQLLWIGGSKVDDRWTDCATLLESVDFLDLSGSIVSGRSIQGIVSLKSLTTLKIVNTRFSESDVNDLKRAKPQLVIIK